jgi:hypothetical protein
LNLNIWSHISCWIRFSGFYETEFAFKEQ